MQTGPLVSFERTESSARALLAEHVAQLDSFRSASTEVLPSFARSPIFALQDKKSLAKTLSSRLCSYSTTADQMSTVKPKAAATNRGLLTARHWQDIRRAARLARSEGVTLILHGITIDPTARGQENQPQPENTSPMTTVRDGSGQQPKGSIGHSCENPIAKQHERQPPSKKQRDQQRSLQRLHDHQQAKACGTRWLPLVRGLLRRNSATTRSDARTAHLRELALHDTTRYLLKRAQILRSTAAKQAIGGLNPLLIKLRQLAVHFGWLAGMRAAGKMKLRMNGAAGLRNFFTAYRTTHAYDAAGKLLDNEFAASRRDELSPSGHASLRHTPPRKAPALDNRHSAKRANKGSRLRRR